MDELNLQGKACLVKIKILNDVQTKANITFFSEEDEDILTSCITGHTK